MHLVCYYILKCNSFLWCKAEFSASLLQSSVSHDPSEIILMCLFGAQYFLLLSVLNKVVLLNIFVEITIHYFQDSLMNSKFREAGFI